MPTTTTLPDYEEKLVTIKGAPVATWRKEVAAGKTNLGYKEWATFRSGRILKKDTVVGCGDENGKCFGIVQKDAIAKPNTKILIRIIHEHEWDLEFAVSTDDDDIDFDAVKAYDNQINGHLRRARPGEEWSKIPFKYLYEVDGVWQHRLMDLIQKNEAELVEEYKALDEYMKDPNKDKRPESPEGFKDERDELITSSRYAKIILHRAKNNPEFPKASDDE